MKGLKTLNLKRLHIYSSNKFIKSIIIERSIFLHFPSCVYFLKMNMFQLSSLSNRIISIGSVIIASVGRSVGGRCVDGSMSEWSVVGSSLGRWSVDLIKPILYRNCQLMFGMTYVTKQALYRFFEFFKSFKSTAI